jgi:acetoin utilization protein AcuB
MSGIRRVSEFMTASPISIDADAAIREAGTLMSVNGFRHLPVVRDGEMIGIVSQRDLHLAQRLGGANLDSTRVGDIAKLELYTVSPEERIDDVARVLVEKKIGSALVLQGGKLVGIFTTTDALYALSAILGGSPRS